MFWIQRPGQEHVDIIRFYNEVFIPSVKTLLVELGPAVTTTKANVVPEANNNNDGMLLLLKFNSNYRNLFVVSFATFILISPILFSLAISSMSRIT